MEQTRQHAVSLSWTAFCCSGISIKALHSMQVPECGMQDHATVREICHILMATGRLSERAIPALQ